MLKVIASTRTDGEGFVLEVGLPGDLLATPFHEKPNEEKTSCVAVTDATVITIGDRHIGVLMEDADASRVFLAALARRVRRASDRCVRLKTEDAHTRTANVMCELADRLGKTDDGCVVVHHPLRHKDLAQMVGLSRETFSAIQRNFADRGWIERGRGSLTILDEPALRRRARLAPARSSPHGG